MDNIAAERQYPTPFVNSSLLPLLLMSLAVQRHTPDGTPSFQGEYDYIIVGAGSSGSVVANRLSEEHCVSVLLLEAGKAPPRVTDVPGVARSFMKTDIDWDYETAPQSHTGAGLINRALAWPSGKALGGTSILNGMFHVRGHRHDYDEWAEQGAIGWSYIEVLPYFKKLEGNRENVDPVYHGLSGPVTVERPAYSSELKEAVEEAAHNLGYTIIDVNGPTQRGFFDMQANLRNGQRCSTAKAYLVPAENRDNLDILTKAFVKKVLIEDGKAVGVLFDHDGEEHEVKAKREVILSAGTVNTAQLLMLSGIGPREHLQENEIPVVADLPVGKNFQDHIGPIMGFEVSDEIPPIQEKLADPDNIQLYISDRKGPLASCEGVAAIAFQTNDRYAPPNVKPDHEVYFMEGAHEVAKTQMNIKPEVFEQVFGPYENKTTFWCISQILHPRSRGYVKLRSSDPYDPPIIDPNYFDDPQDVIDVVGGMKLCLSIGRSQALQRIGAKSFDTLYPGCEHLVDDEDQYLACQAKSVVFTLSHQVGTAKMGDPSDPSTVVDPNLRVKGIRGLRVVDSSVMPLVPSGNTNVPAIMIGEKASDIIKRTIRC